MQRKYFKAFSLIELIVVIAIIGIAAAIAAPAYKAYQARASAASIYPYIESQLRYWEQLYDSNSPLFNQIQPGHFSQAVFIDNPPMDKFNQVILFHQPGCGGPPCSFVTFMFADGSFEFAPGGVQARLLYVPTIDTTSGANSITWSCFFNGQPNFYGPPILTPAQVVAKYFPQCSVG